MRCLPPLLNNNKAGAGTGAGGPKAGPKAGLHSDKLWKVYQHLIHPNTNKQNNPGESEEGYYVTDTILDLDAADSPLTRPYNEQDHAEQIKKWSTNHALDALTKRMHAFRDEVEVAKASWKRQLHRFDERYITERDILSLALLGPGSSAVDGMRNRVSTELLKSIGIHAQIAGDIPLAVRYLAHRRRTQSTGASAGIRAKINPNIKPTSTTSATATVGKRDTKDHKNNTEKENIKTTTTKEIQTLKFVLQKSPPSSIPRIIYHLLSDDNNSHILISKCLPEIISSTTKNIETMPSEDSIRVTIFLRNLVYKLTITKKTTLDADSSTLLDETLQRLARRYGNEFPAPVTAADTAADGNDASPKLEADKALVDDDEACRNSGVDQQRHPRQQT